MGKNIFGNRFLKIFLNYRCNLWLKCTILTFKRVLFSTLNIQLFHLVGRHFLIFIELFFNLHVHLALFFFHVFFLLNCFPSVLIE